MSGNDFLRSGNTSHSAERTWTNAHPSGRHFFPNDRGRIVFVVFWNFDIDSFEPKREHIEFIRSNPRFVRFVQRASADRRYFNFEGRSSRSGDSHQNRTLSYQRALSIKKLIFDMPSYRGSGNPTSLFRGIRARGSSRPINYTGLSEEGQEAYNRSVVIYWGDNCLNPLSRQDIERIGRTYLEERTGWSVDSMTFWGLWTPSQNLFNHIVPAEIGARRDTPSLEVLNRYKEPLSAYIDESHLFRSEVELKSGIDRWLNTVKNARDNRVRQEDLLRNLISSRMSGGGGSAIRNNVLRYEQFVDQYLELNISCVFHSNYNLSRL